MLLLAWWFPYSVILFNPFLIDIWNNNHTPIIHTLKYWFSRVALNKLKIKNPRRFFKDLNSVTPKFIYQVSSFSKVINWRKFHHRIIWTFEIIADYLISILVVIVQLWTGKRLKALSWFVLCAEGWKYFLSL